ncbi:MAG TPA: GNAT family N-acetyltransferase [Candidatus Sulfotelmatobacter sp.]|nr:GNAT family N-acetyltransferase [Candidatus Sulfotelmatobacter sp.]
MKDNSLEIRTFRSLDDLLGISESWEELLASYPLATTFSTPAWLASWWPSFAKGQELLASGFFGDSRLVALALFSITRVQVAKAVSLKQLRLMGDGSNDSDNLDLPVLPGFEQQFATSLLDFLETERNSWDFAEFNTLPPDSPAAKVLKERMAARKWLVIEESRAASAIPLPNTWEKYLEQLSSEDQKNLVRYERRLGKRYSVEMYRCSSESQIPKCLEALFEHHQARWQAAGESGSFGVAERRAFYADLSRRLLSEGRLDLWALELDGQIAAVQFGFRYGRQVFQLQEGNDPRHAPDRVGFILRGHVLKQLIADGVQTYDFLGGALGYKARWGAQARHYFDVHFARPLTMGAVYLQMTHGAAHSKAWLRKNLPQPAWDALRKLNLRARRFRGKKP